MIINSLKALNTLHSKVPSPMTAFVISSDEPRSLNEPVGLAASYFTRNFSVWGKWENGVDTISYNVGTRKAMKSMADPGQPLAEVFGHLTTDHTERAVRYRSRRLCPFNNKVPNCTKDKAKNPLGLCAIYHDSHPVITCPIRFREDWIIADDAASFFFKEETAWSSLTEVRLNDLHGKTAGNIDVILVAYDKNGKVYDFGALEIQAVYISGNVRDPFEYFMKDPKGRASVDDFIKLLQEKLDEQLETPPVNKTIERPF